MLTTRTLTPTSRTVTRTTAVRCPSLPQRRELLAATFLTPILFSEPALALLPDDDDADLVTKAKSNRKSRLALEKQTERTFLQGEGMTNVRLSPLLVPIQKGIRQLAVAGTALSSNDVKAAASAMSEGNWQSSFRSSIVSVSVTEGAKGTADGVLKSLQALSDAAGKNNGNGAKSAFVKTVDSLKGWSNEAGVAALLKGL